MVQTGPVAGLNEVGPVEGMEVRVSLEHVELHLSQGLAAAHVLFEVLVVVGHQEARAVIADGPEAHDQRLSSRDYKGAPQSVDAFAVAYFAHSGVAGGQDHQLRAP